MIKPTVWKLDKPTVQYSDMELLYITVKIWIMDTRIKGINLKTGMLLIKLYYGSFIYYQSFSL